MALTLEQYVCEYLPGRGLTWPMMPKIVPAKAKPSLRPLGVKAVLWNVYGTLLCISTGDLQFESDIEFMTDAALDKTILEFKMWNSMSRKPGAPAAYMKELFRKAYELVRLTGQGEIRGELIWDDIVRKLMTKEYSYDGSTLGPPSELVKKIAYFYHANIQGTGCYPGAAEALRLVSQAGLKQGLLANGQCFTTAQLRKALLEQDAQFDLAQHLPAALHTLSIQIKVRKPHDDVFKAALLPFRTLGIKPAEVLHVGSDLLRDIAPAKKHGMKTALFAGDRNSLAATPEQLQDAQFRPDALLTELTQIHALFGAEE